MKDRRETKVTLELHPAKIVRVLSLTALLLMLLSVAGQIYTYQLNDGTMSPLVMKFYIDGEANIPTFYSSYILLFVSLLLGVIYFRQCTLNDRYRLPWFLLAAGFLFLSVNESTLLYHDLLSPLFKHLKMYMTGVVGISIISVALILILYQSVWFFIYLPGRYRTPFALAGALYLSGAVGMDKIGTMYHEVHTKFNLSYSMLATLEAIVEMSGILVFIYALLTYLSEMDSIDMKNKGDIRNSQLSQNDPSVTMRS